MPSRQARMSLTRKQLSLLHAGRRQLGLSDGDYRAILMEAAGAASARDLDTDGLAAVVRRFEAMGFTLRGPRRYGPRAGMASDAQIARLRALWAQYTAGAGDDASLGTWLARTFQVSHVRFLRMSVARQAITALQSMVARTAA